MMNESTIKYSPSQEKHSNYAEMTVCKCPSKPLELNVLNKEVKACRKIDSDYTISKIQELINDCYTCNNHNRISSLLYDFLYATEGKGYYMKHLIAIMDILEFLSCKSKEVKYFQVHLDYMLDLCSQPLLLERNSEVLSCIEVLEQYFTVLGYLLLTLSTKEEISKICRALYYLLFKSNTVDVSTVPLEMRHQAMENSQLPVVLAKLLEVSSSDIYEQVLDLVFILVSVSSKCCRSFLKSEILNHLLIRMHPSYGPEFHLVPPVETSDLHLDEDDYYDVMILSTNIMWALMKIALPLRQRVSNLKMLAIPSLSAMWSLRCAFRREILRSRRSKKSLMMRNDIAALILAGIVTLPSWKLLRTGLTDDIAILVVATEFGAENTWVSNVKFNTSNEDLMFKKILLLIICHLAESEAAVKIMINKLVVPAVLQLINPEIANLKTPWSTSQFWYITQYAMNTLTYLVPKLPAEFITHKGPLRLIMMLEWSMKVEFDVAMIINLMKTICSIITSNCKMVLGAFRDQGLVISLIKLANHTLKCESFTMQHQRLLTLLMISIEEVMKNKMYLREMYGDQSIKLTLRLLRKCLDKKNGAFHLDKRILVTIGSYIWECIVWCPMNVERFIESGGIYLMLDVIEDAILPVRCVYLGALTDMCQVVFCGSHLCTWRGVDKSKGFVSFLAETWRKEEIKTRVKRDSQGCIEDLELPLMGEEQWHETYHSVITHDYSPAFSEMLGSVRPKIYGIQKIIEEEITKYEKTKEHYKILMEDVPVQDLVTMCIIDKYYQLKKGQVWIEISRFLEHNGVHPLGMDGEVMYLMIEHHRQCAMSIREEQEKLISKLKKKEESEEKDRFFRMRKSKLASALTAIREIDYIRRTSDKEYKNRQERQRRNVIENTVKFHHDEGEKHFDRIKLNFMNISRLNYSIPTSEVQDVYCTNSDLKLNSSTNSDLSCVSVSMLSNEGCSTNSNASNEVSS